MHECHGNHRQIVFCMTERIALVSMIYTSSLPWSDLDFGSGGSIFGFNIGITNINIGIYYHYWDILSILGYIINIYKILYDMNAYRCFKQIITSVIGLLIINTFIFSSFSDISCKILTRMSHMHGHFFANA